MWFLLLLFLLLASCGTYFTAAISVGKPINTDPSLVLSNPANDETHCVSGEHWPEWRGSIDFVGCADSLRAMISRVPADQPYIFWSGAARDQPSVPWPWKIPQHTDAGKLLLNATYYALRIVVDSCRPPLRKPQLIATEHLGDCTFLVRMLADFDSNTLPIDGSHTWDTSQNARVSPSTWSHINAAAAGLILKCLKLPTPASGWMRVNDDIAVFMLPLRSLMRFYWANNLSLEAFHRKNRTASALNSNRPSLLE